MRDDIHCLSRQMESIKEGVIYFRKFVDCPEEQEQQRTQHEEKCAIREAQEYEERRLMNKLIWR